MFNFMYKIKTLNTKIIKNKKIFLEKKNKLKLNIKKNLKLYFVKLHSPITNVLLRKIFNLDLSKYLFFVLHIF